MVSKSTITQALPPFKGDRVLIFTDQSANDIVREILLTHSDYAGQYDLIYQYFDTGDIYETGKKIWGFLKYNLVYNAETGDDQTVKSPAAILHPGEKIDCKHYSLFIGGVLDAIKRHENEKWDWCYRFASYNHENIPAHVFVVAKEPGEDDIWIDPVLERYDQKKQPNYFIDKKPAMSLSKISGPNDGSQNVEVDPKKAFESFLVMLNLNSLGLRDLMLSNSGVTYSTVKNWIINQGFDWLQVENLLYNGKR